MLIQVNGDENQRVGWWIGRAVQCRLCECRFTLEKHDAVMIQRDDRWQRANINCPNCGQNAFIENMRFEDRKEGIEL